MSAPVTQATQRFWDFIMCTKLIKLFNAAITYCCKLCNWWKIQFGNYMLKKEVTEPLIWDPHKLASVKFAATTICSSASRYATHPALDIQDGNCISAEANQPGWKWKHRFNYWFSISSFVSNYSHDGCTSKDNSSRTFIRHISTS